MAMKVAAAYIPVVHRGHQEFLKKVQPDVLYVLGKSFQADFPFLERDIRALTPHEIQKMCQTLGFASDVRILEKDTLSDLKKAQKIIFSDDHVMRMLAEKYLSGISVDFEKIFLRWDKMAAITATPVSSDGEISTKELDRTFLQSARYEARKSSNWWRQVGAVAVKNQKIIFAGFNEHKPSEHITYIEGDPRSNFDAGDPHLKNMYTEIHGEANVIAQAARQGVSLQDASIYVTTFPCPSCALQIIESGIREIYYADGYSNLNAEQNLRSAGIKLIRVLES